MAIVAGGVIRLKTLTTPTTEMYLELEDTGVLELEGTYEGQYLLIEVE